MKIKTMLAPLAAVLMLTSCEDIFEEGSLKPDGSAPYVEVSNPTNNQILGASQELRIKLTAVDKDNVKHITFTVQGNESEAPLLSFNKMLDKRVVEFDTLVTLNHAKPGDYSLLISATDNRANQTLKEVKLKVK